MDVGNRNAVDKSLSRLARKGTIRRLSRGLYDYPRIHPDLGLLSPEIEQVAKALVGKDHIKLQPSGAYASNLLGLSEQVPAKVVFLTDGASRTVSMGRQIIQLRRTTPRNMAAAGRLSGLLIQAFRHLGKDHVTSFRVEQLKRRLPEAERKGLLKDLKIVPAWMHPIFLQLAEISL